MNGKGSAASSSSSSKGSNPNSASKSAARGGTATGPGSGHGLGGGHSNTGSNAAHSGTTPKGDTRSTSSSKTRDPVSKSRQLSRDNFGIPGNAPARSFGEVAASLSSKSRMSRQGVAVGTYANKAVRNGYLSSYAASIAGKRVTAIYRDPTTGRFNGMAMFKGTKGTVSVSFTGSQTGALSISSKDPHIRAELRSEVSRARAMFADIDRMEGRTGLNVGVRTSMDSELGSSIDSHRMRMSPTSVEIGLPVSKPTPNFKSPTSLAKEVAPHQDWKGQLNRSETKSHLPAGRHKSAHSAPEPHSHNSVLSPSELRSMSSIAAPNSDQTRPAYPSSESADKDAAVISAGRSGWADLPALLSDVYGLFRTNGPFDYKAHYGPEYQDLGNYNFGKTLRKVGFPSWLILRSAGAYQKYAPLTNMQRIARALGYYEKYGTRDTYSPSFGGPLDLGRSSYGDDPRDQNQLRMGIEDADRESRQPSH